MALKPASITYLLRVVEVSVEETCEELTVREMGVLLALRRLENSGTSAQIRFSVTLDNEFRVYTGSGADRKSLPIDGLIAVEEPEQLADALTMLTKQKLLGQFTARALIGDRFVEHVVFALTDRGVTAAKKVSGRITKKQ